MVTLIIGQRSFVLIVVACSCVLSLSASSIAFGQGSSGRSNVSGIFSAANASAPPDLLVDVSDPSCSDPLGAPFCSIAAAILAAFDGDVIGVGAGVYAEELIVDRNVALVGSGTAETTISGAGAHRPVHVLPTVMASISHLTISGGFDGTGGGGGGVRNEGSLNMCAVVVESSRSSSLQDPDFPGGGGCGRGGGLWNAGDLFLDSVVIAGNRAGDGFMCGLGGGLWNQGTALIVNSDFRSNAADDGGAIENRGVLEVAATRFFRNSADTPPGTGGTLRSSGPLELRAGSIEESQGDLGASVHIYGGGALFEDLELLASDSSGSQGNFFVSSGSVIIRRSTLRDGHGTGIQLQRGSVSVEESTITGYQGGGGGGILQTGGTLEITNSTITANGSGGPAGIWVVGGTAEVSSSTVTGNNGGGAGADLMGSIRLGSSIVGECGGVVDSLGYNLIENAAGCVVTGETTGNLLGVAPELGPLQPNGGPTDTLALLQGSPAIDAGATVGCEPADQRGVARPQGPRCDIGAFELEAVVPPVIDLELTAVVGPNTIVLGETFPGPVTVVATNAGEETIGGPGEELVVLLLVSSDPIITPGDSALINGELTIALDLAPGQAASATTTLPLVLPAGGAPVGSAFLGAFAAGLPEEADLSNNAVAQPLFVIDPCPDGLVIGADELGNELSFASVQEAVDASGRGGTIFLGDGVFPELVNVSGKRDLVVESLCEATIYGLDVEDSRRITFRGLDVDATATGARGVRLRDSRKVTFHEVSVRGSARTGVRIDDLSRDVVVSRCDVSGNANHGISSRGADTVIVGSKIHANGGQGVRVREGPARLVANEITGNGSYGVRRQRTTPEPGPGSLLLVDNTIAGNGGTPVPDSSSADLGNYDLILDASDVANVTTAGDEGVGVEQLIP